jgi:regulation of enolase protein 1 (concanavalin A-like superfamily)
MIRETLTAGSRHVLLDMKPSGGVEFMARAASGGSTSYIAGGTGRWLRLVRSGNTFTAYVSTDGAAWRSIGSRSVTMSATVWVGLAVCSHNTGVLNTSVFDNVAVGAPPGGSTGLPPTVRLTSPTLTLYEQGTSIPLAATATAGDAPVARVEFYANNGTTNTRLAADTTSPYSYTWVNAAPGPYRLTAVATDTANRSATSNVAEVFVRPPEPPLGAWTVQDIGAVGAAGDAVPDGSGFWVSGAGADIWGSADSFNFLSIPRTGDVQILARVRSMENTHAYAKAGVMIRESNAPGSRHVLLSMRPNGGVEFLARAATGGPTAFVGGGTGSWLKLVRRSGLFSAYVSRDALTWVSLGSTSVTMPTNVLVGLAVCSHDTSRLNRAAFDNIALGAPTAPGPLVTVATPPNGATFPPDARIVFEIGYGDPVYRPNARVYVDDGITRRVVGDYRIGDIILAEVLPVGSYTVTAVTDEGVTSRPITINVSTTPGQNRPPVVSATTGANGAFTVTATDTDAWPLARIDIYAFEIELGELWINYVGSSARSPYTVTRPAAAESMWVVARDTAGLAVVYSFR